MTRVKEETWQARGFLWLEQFFGDVCYGTRALWRDPGFTIVAVLTLALGIGANTAIFSVVQGVILSPLPYAQPDRLVMVHTSRPGLKRLATSYPDFRDWRQNSRSFEEMAALTTRNFDVTISGASEHLDGMEFSAGLFATLGVRLALGREFSTSEDQLNGVPAVIVSDRFWKDRFASSPQALGKTMVLDGKDATIVGVLAPGFALWANADVYTPLGQGEPLLYDDRSIHGIAVIGRLEPNVTFGQAQAEMSAVQSNLDRMYPVADHNLAPNIEPLKQSIIGDVGGMLLLLLGAAGVVLMIACINVANLLLARAAARTREYAIRSALGASRSRIVRQSLTESVLLALTGGIIGLMVAKLGVNLILAEFSANLPHAENIGLNLPVLVFAIGISLTIGVLFGVSPALNSSRVMCRIHSKRAVAALRELTLVGKAL